VTNRPQTGFTLIELAVAMFIIVLLLGSILIPLTTQVNQRKVSDTQKIMEDIKEALIGYAVVHRHLPCPAISASNGMEDRTADTCTGGKRQGFIPWESLGVPKADAWGNIFRYSVTPAFASSASFFETDTASDITIRTRNAAGSLVTITNTNIVPAVILSHGANGYGATSSEGVAQGLPANWPASFPDENTNATGSTGFISRAQQGPDSGGVGGEFDDLVSWVARYGLLNRMITAGKLPN
jgi:prepilin-type N-terminal cleavage/methylation domain-containing protein